MKTTWNAGVIVILSLVTLSACSKRTAGPAADTARPAPPPPPAEASNILSPRQDTWGYSVMPEPAPSVTPKRRLNEVTFAANATDFDAQATAVCRETSAQVKASSAMRILMLGYCNKSENVGLGANDLGLRRAEKLRQCFATNGVPRERIEISSFGARFSEADRIEPITQKQERRVEIWILSE